MEAPHLSFYRTKGAILRPHLQFPVAAATQASGHATVADSKEDELSQEVASRISQAATTGSLDLSDCGLEEVPDVIWKFEDLVDLSLAGNRIRHLSPAIGNLKQLRRLGLAGNRLRSIPSAIGGLVRLEGLWLHGNLLESLPPAIGRLEQLRMLALAGNRLAALPEEVAAMSSLQVLSVAGNDLLELPRDLGRLPRLRVLAANGNRLRSLPPGLGSLASLEDLWLQGNALASLPKDLGSLAALRQLSLADNVLSELPASVGGLQTLETLWLYGNRLTHLPPTLKDARQLWNLWVESNPLEPSSLSELLPHLTHLKNLGLDRQQAGRLPPRAAGRTEEHVTCGRIVGTGAAAESGGYFKLHEWRSGRGLSAAAAEAPPGGAARVVVVAFSSAPGVPNWGGLLNKIRREMEAAGGTPPAFDVLYVVDPSRTWYINGPHVHRGGATSAPPPPPPPAPATSAAPAAPLPPEAPSNGAGPAERGSSSAPALSVERRGAAVGSTPGGGLGEGSAPAAAPGGVEDLDDFANRAGARASLDTEIVPGGAATAGLLAAGGGAKAPGGAAVQTLPGGGSGHPSGGEVAGEYYRKEVKAATEGYREVILLGDSMGATGALLYSPLATCVVAFSPQVNLATSSIRPAHDEGPLRAYAAQLVTAVQSSAADIEIHCGNWSHDSDQANLVKSEKVKVIIHSVNDHRLAKELDGDGELSNIVRTKIREAMERQGI